MDEPFEGIRVSIGNGKSVITLEQVKPSDSLQEIYDDAHRLWAFLAEGE